MTIKHFIYTHSDIQDGSYYQVIQNMELYNQHTAAQGACYVSKYIPLDNPTFHLMTAIQHELHHNYQFLFLVICQNILQLDDWTHHSFGSQLQFGLLDSSFI